MGYTIALHNAPVEICRFHGVQWGSMQLGSGCSSVKCSIVKVSTSHLTCSNKCSHRIHSCLPWKVDNGSKREAVSLVCRGLQRNVCIDTDEFDQDECMSSEDSNSSAKRKFKEQINSKKFSNPMTSASDGPFVRNDEEANNDVLQKFCSNGKLNDATRLIEIMARQNQIPDFPSCINLIRGFVKVNELDKANKVLQIMIMSGGIPDNITYNMMVRGLCKRGQIRSAIDLLENMSLSGCPPDVITYNTIIRCMFDNGIFDQAVGFWKDQLRKGCPPYLITYTILIELVCKHCGIARAIEVLHDMAIEGCYPDIVTYNSLVNLSCKQGKYDDAALVIYNIISHGLELNAVTYNTLIHSLCNHGCWDEVDELFPGSNQVEGAVGILKVMAEMKHRVGTSGYKMVILELCKADKVDLAIQVLEMMVSTRIKPDEYSTIIKGLANAGMKQKANKLHQKLTEWEVFRERKPWS
ncbi:hypothetical protein like AT1G08610 [Hibiscus trionum]|uniref:Pentatricopeptide repeat-containing protein n=1 Tax=Hibiscus trionum TaxID=183268 RepID=A0A9W7HUE5_HIBTR|nr:hypothetical protein like AT1G08610 [Hibiscus trionum]